MHSLDMQFGTFSHKTIANLVSGEAMLRLNSTNTALRGMPTDRTSGVARKSAAAVLIATALLAAPAIVLGAGPVRLEDPIPALIPASNITVDLKPVASGLIAPVASAVAPGDKDHIYVADQVGKLYKVSVSDRTPGGSPSVFLDVTDRIVKVGLFPPLNYDERGLLGIAFHPDFKRNGLFYTFTSQPAVGKADFSTQPVGVAPDCHTVITEWKTAQPGVKDSPVDYNSARVMMRIDKPQFNHNGGTLVFGPDKMLYISVGDGGAADDEGPGHVAGGNGQSLAAGNVLGKILRIDPLGRNSANGKYGVPADNPFVGKTGADEIYAYGFRNPYRMSFDQETGKLYAGDVGQNDIEEVDVVVKGGNYGWPIKEGTFLFDTGNGRPAPDVGKGFVFQDSPGQPAGLIDPIAQYDHVDGAGLPEIRVSVIGGFVYRGDKIKKLRGKYVFGDYSAEIGEAANGHLYVLGKNNRVEEIQVAGRTSLGLAVLGWGRDHDGELYLLANGTGTLNGTTGVVLKLARVHGSGGDDDERD
jgi:glucose/arabinose dehydrogenase